MTDNNTRAIPEVDRESLIKQLLPLAGARVIDVGCGEGFYTGSLQDCYDLQPLRFYGIDISKFYGPGTGGLDI